MELLKNEIKKRLKGKVIDQLEYTDELILALYGLKVVPNTVDFDIDRIYKIGYDDIDENGEYKNNWDDYYICSLDIELIDDNIKILDVY